MPLSRTEFLRASTLLPVVVPIAALGVGVALWPLGIAIPRWLEPPVELAVGGLFYFMPFYAVAILPLVVVIAGRSFRAHVAAALVAPVVMAAVTTGAFWLFADDPRDASELATLVVSVGYSYVALSFVGLFVASRAGWIRHDDGPRQGR
jgi:hypothetical protein